MSARFTAAGLFLVLASIACSAARTPAMSAPAQRAKEVCNHDSDCAPYWSCTSDHRCRCQLDEDCAATQQCRAGLCLSR